MIDTDLTFIACDATYDEASSVIFGAPFDGTTSYRPGARFGPQHIRMESNGLETYSPYQQRDLTDFAICDTGDLELPFGNTKKVLELIEERTEQILGDKKMPVMLGGEHLVTLGAMRSIVKHYPDVRIVHFDAHTDLRNDYLGEALSHATVIRRVWELIGDDRIYQFGIRSGERDEFEFASQHTNLLAVTADDVYQAYDTIKHQPIYITLDLDVLDPSLFAGTGTPEAGGLFFNELLKCLRVFKDCHIVGFDLVELAPHYDASGVSTAVAGKLLREMLLAYSKEA